jgi:hypothetical protein
MVGVKAPLEAPCYTLTKDTYFVTVPAVMPPPLRVAALGLAVAASAAAPRSAAADDAPFTIGSRPAWFLLGGVTSGGTVAFADRGAYVGGELSIARLRAGTYFGLYADGYYDWGADGTYVTGGLELGRKFIGVDGGAALRLAGGERELGVTGRLNVSVGVFGLYARYAYFPDAMEDDHVLQVGLSLKLPLMTFGGNAR